MIDRFVLSKRLRAAASKARRTAKAYPKDQQHRHVVAGYDMVRHGRLFRCATCAKTVLVPHNAIGDELNGWELPNPLAQHLDEIATSIRGPGGAFAWVPHHRAKDL